VNTGKNSLTNRLLAGVIFFLLCTGMYGQDCFSINTAQSKIIVSPGANIDFPNNGETIKLPCTKTVNNFSIIVDFHFNMESYFENSVQMIATLMHKGSIYIMVYNKADNSFKLLNDLPNLGEGNFLFTVTATNCATGGTPCNNCTVSHNFDILYNQDTNLPISITTDPTPPILNCFPNSSVTLTGTPPPNNSFKTQWARLINNEFVIIIGATTDTLKSTQAGTYQYILTGPGGCAATNNMTVSPPQLPKVAVMPDTQNLNSCTQEIKGIDISNFGGDPANIQYAWTASNNGEINSGENTPNPVIGAPGTYTVVVSRKDNGCTATASVTVVLGDIQIVSIDVSKTPDQEQLDCRFSSILLKATASLSSDSSGFTYLWSTGATSPEINVDLPGVYSVTATAALNGCQGARATTITKDVTKPILSIQSIRDTVCAGESVNLIASAQEPGIYKWSDNTAGNVYNAMPATDGDNWYTVTVTASDNGCTNSASKAIVRIPIPEVLCADLTLTVENGGRLSLDCDAGADEMIWITTTANVRDMPPLGGGPVQDQLFSLIEGRTPGTVLYYFYAKNQGCTSDRSEVLVEVLPKSTDGIFIPELITPNGDGLNDTWGIVLSDDIQNPEAYQLTLFSRNGSKVYSSTLATPFNAYDYPDGVYYYVITKPNGGDINGAVTILRRQ